MNNSTPKYVISIASEILGIHPQTLRQYERLGFIIPARTDGKNRLYSEEDIDKVRFITKLTREMGVNLAGVEIILNLQEQISILNKELINVKNRLNQQYGESITIQNIEQNKERKVIRTIKIERE